MGAIELLAIAALGLFGGAVGGLLGVGGSVVVIPGLTVLIGPSQHLYQAAAMLMNVAVALPAARRHHAAGAVMTELLPAMIPSALVTVLFGVWVSNLPFFSGDDGGLWLGRVLALFLVYVVALNVRRLLVGASQRERVLVTETGRVLCVGLITGLVAGLLGIGGGAVAVPLQQAVLGLPLRNCIANSSAVMVLSAALGAVYKNSTLGAHGLALEQSLLLAGMLAPSALVGSRLGAALTHRLPLKPVRLLFVLMTLAAIWKMAALPI